MGVRNSALTRRRAKYFENAGGVALKLSVYEQTAKVLLELLEHVVKLDSG